jgi:homocysteine S-methyltransferase
MPSPFLAALAPATLAADGAMGTELYARGLGYDTNYEGLNLARPALVTDVHRAYVRAGARVLATNTFGANRVRLARHGLERRAADLNRAAVRLAREAARGEAFVVGAVGPTGLAFAGASARSDARAADEAFREQAAALASAGVDALLVETMGRLDELLLAARAARAEAPGVPLVAQMTVDRRLALADGASVDDAGRRLRDAGADALGVNCCDGPHTALLAAERLLPLGPPVAVAPSAGLPRAAGDRLVYPVSPDDFGAFARAARALGVALVGGCCGTTPAHVRAAVRALGAR